MKRFTFSLDPALAFRRSVEERERRAFADAQSALQAALAERDRLHSAFKMRAASFRPEGRLCEGEDLRLHYAHLELLDRAICLQHDLVAQRRAAVEQARCKLLEAQKNCRVLEKLKSRRYMQHLSEAGAMEQREIEDANNHPANLGAHSSR